MSEKLIVAFIAGAFGMIGAFIGYFASYFIEKRKNSMAFNQKVFDTYDRVSQEIIEALAEITTFSVRIKSYSKEDIETWKEKISYLSFKYYRYLPPEVLVEMNCLHSCLRDYGKSIYIARKDKNEKKYTIKQCRDKKDVDDFCDNITLVTNLKKIKEIAHKYGIEKVPKSIKINFQARMVVRRIDGYWQYKDFVKRIQKQAFFRSAPKVRCERQRHILE